MRVVNELYMWTDYIVVFGPVLLRTWALLDCLVRKAEAFPAVNKLTKASWAAMLLIGDFLGYYLTAVQGPLSIFSLVTIVLASVYLADVRPAVREITEGR